MMKNNLYYSGRLSPTISPVNMRLKGNRDYAKLENTNFEN